MLGQRGRLWPSIKPTLVQHLASTYYRFNPLGTDVDYIRDTSICVIMFVQVKYVVTSVTIRCPVVKFFTNKSSHLEVVDHSRETQIQLKENSHVID